ncbi:MAG: hypothetical protein UX51_C0049G0005 [Candidatus Azambacteria bacterium GW2011_GWF2_46_32]|uniref:t-SNARE coiled-coil homology domain-containing protein n=2 Tax=Candidatus Azamiibacteriota TaxID=1752741 RepID=A0A0G1NJC9_9BACT|nr:MAG: hypothetical protein UX33_C0042G0006 [Candidatus Azambacteria bacterium GW2011_GWC1_46_13]KKU36406.1 MAG: hypothetical protein UX51_C0049G0005 [Candidatus Azambacteria bacterium GW2011_GWF2_46_32]HAM96176.1 hypothetical protein [Candidatus Azambacteria bacterium]
MANKKITIDDLAIMVQKGFDETNEKLGGRMDKLDGRMDKLDGRMDKLDGRMDVLEKKVDDGFSHVEAGLDAINKNIKELDFVTKDEFEDLMTRVKYIEAKLGIKSGK